MEDTMTDARVVFRTLSANRACADDVQERPEPGVYAIFAGVRDCLPGIVLPESGLVYIGLSSNLAERNHFQAKYSGFSSPRRSLGAILKSDLSLSAEPRTGPSQANYKNYRFAGDGEKRLTAWMRQNLRYSVHPYEGDLNALEKRLIVENEPPLNLIKWPNPQKPHIENLGRACRLEAKLVRDART